MLALPGSPVRTSEGVTRREWLRAGAASAVGLNLPDLLRAEATNPGAAPARAKSCILVFLFGAPAHQDVWDLKPAAPAEVRGEFRPVATTVPGIAVTEHLPRTARQAHRLAL